MCKNSQNNRYGPPGLLDLEGLGRVCLQRCGNENATKSKMTPITTPTTVPASAPELRVLGCVAREAGLGDAACDGEDSVLEIAVGEGELTVPLDPEGDILLFVRQLISCPSSTKNVLEVADIPAVPLVSNATATYDPSWTSTELQSACWALDEIASVNVRDTRA